MFNISNYKVVKNIYENSNTVVSRAIRDSDKKSVIIKFLKKEYPTSTDLEHYKHEFEILKDIDSDSIIKIYSYKEYQNRCFLVLEDCNGTSLKKILNKGVLDIEEFLYFALKIVKALKELHAKDIIHKDINPTNILIDESDNVKIIDFGISSNIVYEKTVLKAPNKLEGTLNYISPEQTGRMNRGIDYRSDFYSLGVTFHEMLLGRVPFKYDDMIELIHAHIAKIPLALNEINSTIPKIISKIVLKLLAKDAQSRYQSLHGLESDLNKCLDELQSSDDLIDFDFELALNDYAKKFKISSELYGRERELQILIDSCNNITDSSAKLILISGYSGVGKSALINEIHKPLTEKRGYFANGKFDQYQRNIPYYAITQSFNKLCHYLLTEKGEYLNSLKEKILKSVGTHIHLLLDVIPSLEFIIGEQEDIELEVSKNMQSMFIIAFKNLLASICSKEHPLILFIDDWQWADLASLALLKELLINKDVENLLIIGAYRDNEVDDKHPFQLTLDELKSTHLEIEDIKLNNLSFSNVNSLIKDSLNTTQPNIDFLTDLVYKKTKGNAFFTTTFLKTLYEEKLLDFDLERKEWSWDIEQINLKGISDNVVDILANKVSKLDKNTQNLLKFATCIGNEFDIDILSIISSKSISDIKKILRKAITEELVVKSDDTYSFVHDRVNQAIYTSIDEKEKNIIHKNIGNLLFDRLREEDIEDNIFKIVDNLNIAIDLIESEKEKNILIELNLVATKKAKDSVAYRGALNYLDKALSLLSEYSWESDYELTLDIYSKKVELLYLIGELEQLNALIDEIDIEINSDLDRIKIYEIQIRAFIAQNRFSEAIELALKVLNLLGVKLPTKPNMGHILYYLMKTKLFLRKKSTKDILNLPNMRDKKKLLAMRIILSVVPAAYFGLPKLFPILIFKMVRLSLKYGNSKESSYSYVSYGIVLYSVLNDIENGVDFGKLGLDIEKKLEAKEYASMNVIASTGHLFHSKISIKNLLGNYLKGYKAGLECGDLAYLSYCLIQKNYTEFFIGEDLNKLSKETKNTTDTVKALKQDSVNYNLALEQSILDLTSVDKIEVLEGEVFNKRGNISKYLEVGDKSSLFFTYFYSMYLNYIFENYEYANRDSKEVVKYIESVLGTFLVPLYYFYDSLNLLSIINISKKDIKRVKSNQKKLKLLSRHAPENYLNKFYLVEAELNRVLGKFELAKDYYDLAIKKSIKSGFLNEEALSYELAGKFYLIKGAEHFVKLFFNNAYYSYSKWGAKAKLNLLQKNYSSFITREASSSLEYADDSTSSFTASSHGVTSQLDLNTIVKANQNLSSEVKLSSLLEKMMNIVVENAGAERGVLLLKNRDSWSIEAKSDVNSSKVELFDSMLLSECKEIAKSIINYVEHTKKSVLIKNAQLDEKFLNDKYIKEFKPKSILTIPLINKSNLIGILYLENNQIEGAFTPDRFEILTILSNQMAISIENATLYDNLEQKVAERTEELEESKQTILDSIEYASLIQGSILPSKNSIKNYFENSFVIWKPKDIVGGDIYLFEEFEDGALLFVIDCTGHGVAGAFMTMITKTALNSIVNKSNYKNPAEILSKLNIEIKDLLKQTHGKTSAGDSGLDGGVIFFDSINRKVTFASAKTPLFYIKDSKLNIIKGDRKSVGYSRVSKDFKFKNYNFDIDEDTYIYVTTDGFIDQCGGDSMLPFGKKKLQKLLLENHKKDFMLQKDIYLRELMKYQGSTDRLDDISFVGFKIDKR